MEESLPSSTRREKRPKRRRLKGVTSFTAYFKEKRRKEQEKKEESLRQAAENLRELLRPHAFSEEEQERLQKLKRYKEWKRIQQQQRERYAPLKAKGVPPPRHDNVPDVPLTSLSMSLGPPVSPETTSYTTKESPFMDALHHHAWGQRIAVISTLIVLLFIGLHADLVAKRLLPDYIFANDEEAVWWACVINDCGRFGQMSICALLHFALSDISMIYAFESLDLGVKTGPKVKKFYREQVHFAMSTISGGIVAFSILWALLMAWVRVIWSIVEMITDLSRDALAAIHQFIYSSVNSVYQLFQDSWEFLKALPFLLYTTAPSDILSAPQIRKSYAFVKSIAATVYTTPPSELVASIYRRITKTLLGICISIIGALLPFDFREELSFGRRILLSLFGNATLSTFESVALVKDDYPLANQTAFLNDTALGPMNETVDIFNAAINRTIPNTTFLDDAINFTEMPDIATTWAMNDTGAEAFQEFQIKETHIATTHLPWIEEAFQTCRYLLSHTAVFLLVVLVAINLLMKSYKHRKEQTTEDETPSRAPPHSPLQIHPNQREGGHQSIAKSPVADTELELMSTNTYSTARPTTITVSISSSSVSSNDDGRQHLHKI